MGFLINKHVPRFMEKRPGLLLCQVLVKPSDYKCLNRDSYLDCAQLYEFENDELSDARDYINSSTKLAIKMAVAVAEPIERCYKKAILNSA